MVPRLSSRPSINCFRGCDTSSLTASTTARIYVTPSPNSATGPWRSSNAPLTRSAFNCSPGDGSLNEPSLGSIETAVWPKISKLRSPAPKPGFTSPPCSSSLGDWLDHKTIYTDQIQPIQLRFGHLEAGRVVLDVPRGSPLLTRKIEQHWVSSAPGEPACRTRLHSKGDCCAAVEPRRIGLGRHRSARVPDLEADPHRLTRPGRG